MTNPDPFLYTVKDDWVKVSELFGSNVMDSGGRINYYDWNPLIQTFPLRPNSVAPAPAGSPPTTAYTLPVQQAVAGTTVSLTTCRRVSLLRGESCNAACGILMWRRAAVSPSCRPVLVLMKRCALSRVLRWVRGHQGWSFQVPDDLFVSNNPGLYGFTLSVTERSGARLPPWIRWNDTAGFLDAEFVQVGGVDFSACPATLEEDPYILCGSLGLTITATDPYGASTSAELDFQIAQSAPTVQNPIGVVERVIDKLWSYKIAETFQVNVREGRLSFTANTYFIHTGHQVDSLPDFLEFKSSSGVVRIEGTPSWDDIGQYTIELIARDAYGWTGTHNFTVRTSQTLCL